MKTVRILDVLPRSISHWFLILCLVSGMPWCGQAADPLLPVGIASVNVTPEYPIRLSGYGSRRTSSDGVEQSLFAKAIAFGTAQDHTLSVVVAVDNVGVPQWITEQVYARIAKQYSLNRSQFTVCSTHTHTAPMLRGVLPNLFSMDLTAEESKTIERYSNELVEKMVGVCVEAIRDSRPSEVWWGQGRALFAKNRRTPKGPVDHDLPMLAVRNPGGAWRGLWVNYACHCTTLGGDFNRHCGDWAGYAQEFLQAQFPGAIALVSIGCGADSDPQPRNALPPAKDHGRAIRDEIVRLLGSPLKRIRALPQGALESFSLAFDSLPTREEWQRRSTLPDIAGYHARVNLARLDRGESLPTELPYSVQSWVFGDDLAMVFLAGEVVVDYALRIKRTYDPRRVWVNAYANDVPCYIPSARVWDEGGYEGGGAMPYYDRPTRLARDTEERIQSRVSKVVPSTFKAVDAGAEIPPAKTPAEALKAFQVHDGLEIELVASEPLVVDPVAVDFGIDGRLWVAEMNDYPMGMDGKYKPGGRLKVLSDTNGDGQYDKAEIWADDLPFPTGVLAYGRGAIVCAAPDILYLEDADGDGRAEIRRVLYTGFATHNFQARVNSLRWGLDGWFYGAAGLFGGTIHSAMLGRDFPLSGRDFRVRFETGDFEAVSGLSQQGRVRDDFGQWFGCDNGSWMWHFPLEDRYLSRNPAVAAGETRVYVPRESNANELFPTSRTLERFNDLDQANRTTSACGLEMYRDHRLGEEYYQNAFICEPVHNLVRRFRVQPEGISYAGRKATEETSTEFLSSTDNWFRPVEVRTGPDGALWIVDMYRFVIEHPRWISPERLAKLDPRAGDHQGRIYRVRSKAVSTPGPSVDLRKRALSEMILDSNGVVRDLAHRRILESGSGALERRDWKSLFRQPSATPAARAQLLCVLQQTHSLDDATWVLALEDKDSGVRRVALQCLEARRFSDGFGAFSTALTKLASDPVLAVRFQLASSLGEWTNSTSARILSLLCRTNLENSMYRSALLSSAPIALAKLVHEGLQMAPAIPGRNEWIKGLIATATHSTQDSVRLAVLEEVVQYATHTTSSRMEPLQLAAALLAHHIQPLPQRLERSMEKLRDTARELLRDPQSTIEVRAVALEMLSHGYAARQDLKLWLPYLEAGTAPELQDAAFRAFQHVAVAEGVDEVLSRWRTLSPEMRQRVSSELISREDACRKWLTAVEAQSIGKDEISIENRQRLLRHLNSKIASRAHQLWPDTRSRARAQVVKDYETAATLPGHPERGLMLFHSNCSSCHSFRDTGHAVGPDIAPFRDKPMNEFLTAILDPSAVIEPRFVAYQIETKDERNLTGVVKNETASSLDVVQSGGRVETLLRSEIHSMSPAGFSLMPEGFESGMNPQDLADLVSYLRMPSVRPFGTASANDSRMALQSLKQSTYFAPIVSASASEQLAYQSWISKLPLLHCRLTDGRSRVDWSVRVPAELPEGSRWSFVIPVGMGLMSQPQGDFVLSLEGRPKLKFQVTLHDAVWESEDRSVQCAYWVKERNSEDSNGVFWISIVRSDIQPGQEMHWSVQGSEHRSMAWFGVYRMPTAP